MGEFLLFEKELPSLISNGEKPKVEKKNRMSNWKKIKDQLSFTLWVEISIKYTSDYVIYIFHIGSWDSF